MRARDGDEVVARLKARVHGEVEQEERVGARPRGDDGFLAAVRAVLPVNGAQLLLHDLRVVGDAEELDGAPRGGYGHRAVVPLCAEGAYAAVGGLAAAVRLDLGDEVEFVLGAHC